MKGEHTELKSAKETKAELKPAEVIKDELSEQSDTNLELDELSDIQEGAGLDAGWNGPFQPKEKFITNLLWVCFMPNLTRPLISPFQAHSHQEISKGSNQKVLVVVIIQESFNVLLISGQKSYLMS